MSFRLHELPRWLRDITPLLLGMALIFWLSSQSVLVDFDDKIEEKLVYKTAHVIAYAILAWLWWRALTPERRADWPVLGLAFGLTTLYGVSDEIHQLFVPGRYGRVTDVLLDGGGALLMILFIRRANWFHTFPENLFSEREEKFH